MHYDEKIAKEKLETAFLDIQPCLIRMFVRMVSASDAEQDSQSAAEDLVHDTFIRAWVASGQYDARQNADIKTWIYRIAINVFNDYWRKRKVRGAGKFSALPWSEGSEGEALIFAEGVTPESSAGYKDLLGKVECVFMTRKCPSYYRSVFVMHEVEGYTLEEIKEATGININTQKVALLRSRKLIQRSLFRI